MPGGNGFPAGQVACLCPNDQPVIIQPNIGSLPFDIVTQAALSNGDIPKLASFMRQKKQSCASGFCVSASRPSGSIQRAGFELAYVYRFATDIGRAVPSGSGLVYLPV